MSWSQRPLFTSYLNHILSGFGLSFTRVLHSPPCISGVLLISRWTQGTSREELSPPWLRCHLMYLSLSSSLLFPKPQAIPPLPWACGRVADDRPLNKLNLWPLPTLAGGFGRLNCLGHSRHNNQEQSEQEENPAEKSGKVKTGARCLSKGKLIVFL